MAAALVLVGASGTSATINCSYSGSGCNAGYSATATFDCISASQLRIRITNTSTINAMAAADNFISTLTFGGAAPVSSASDSVVAAPGSALLPAGQTDCSEVVSGPDVTCEWGAGSNYCTNSASGCAGG